MKCHEIQKLLIQSDKNFIDDTLHASLNRHLKACKDCFQFQSQLRMLHSEAQTLKSINVPDAVDCSTYTICMDCLQKTQVPAEDPIRKWIFILASALVGVSIGFIFFGVLRGYQETYPALEILFWTLLIQNSLTLILSPILLRVKFRQWCIVRPSHQSQTSGQLFGLLF